MFRDVDGLLVRFSEVCRYLNMGSIFEDLLQQDRLHVFGTLISL